MRLTKRDVQLLSYLSEQGVATAGQLTTRFFQSYGSFRVRIRILAQNRYVESVPIQRHRHLLRSRFRGLTQILGSQADFPNFRLYRLGARFKEGKVERELSTPIFWQHQVTLNEVREILKSMIPPETTLLSDPELKSEWARFRLGTEVPIPDLELRHRDFSIAIELERTGKTELRYFERFAAYERSSYARVIYITESPKITETIIRASRRFHKIWVTEVANLQKCFSQQDGYKSLGEVLKRCSSQTSM